MSLEIKSQFGNYNVLFLQGQKISPEHSYVVLIDQKILNHGVDIFPKNSVFVPIDVSEKLKNYQTCGYVIEKLLDLKVNRSTVLYAVGGGALQDIATFVSALYMRGIEWRYIPSTLMSMIDSCIGGKSSINFKQNKNMLGNFNPPTQIYINTDLLETLGELDIASGLAEGYKINFARGLAEFTLFTNLIKNFRESKDVSLLQDAIRQSILSKSWFIEVDELDKSERQLLNFGHSYGHALEAATDFQLLHGVAVFIGMAAAIIRSNLVIKSNQLGRIIYEEIMAVRQLMPKLEINKDIFLKSLEKDKKNSNTIQKLVLLDGLETLKIVEFDLNSDNILACFNDLEEALKELEIVYEVL